MISEWLQLLGYLVEIGVPLPGTGKGGRQEADVVGVKVNETTEGQKVLQIYHVEVGELPRGHAVNVEKLRGKFSNARTQAIVSRFQNRIGFIQPVQYKKIYVDIWPTQRKVDKLMDNENIKQEGIEVWTPRDLFQKVLRTIVQWIPEHKPKLGEATLPESYWMLKQLEHLRLWGLLNID